MTRDVPIVLVDTNIWLDNYLGDRPNSTSSRAFLLQARKHHVELAYPVHVLKDVFFLVQAHLKHKAREQGRLDHHDALAIREIAWSCIQNMRELATAVGADESDAWLACKRKSLMGDLEDSFVIAAAERAQVDFLATNDRGLLRKSTVPAHTAEDAAILLQDG